MQAIPSVAPGTWRLLFVGTPEDSLQVGSGGTLPALATFEVAAGQTVVVDAELPEP